MRYKYQYQNATERANTISTYTDIILIEEQNIVEGNYLVFSDVPIGEPTPIEQQLVDLKDNQMILMSGIFDLYMKP